MKKQNTIQAETFGMIANQTGIMSVPHFDTNFIKWIDENFKEVGSSIEQFRAWHRGWHKAQAAKMMQAI